MECTVTRTCVAQGTTKKVECKNFTMVFSTLLPRATTQYTFDFPKKYEIYHVAANYTFSNGSTKTDVVYLLYIDGKQFDITGITNFREMKTKLQLETINAEAA